MAKILVSEKVHPDGPAMLVAAGHEVIYLQNRDQAELVEKIKEVDAVFVRVMDINREMIESAPNLKMVSKHGVGVDNIDMEACKEKGIVVTITPGANSQAVAEHAFALLMGVAKNLVPVSDRYRKIGFEAKNYPNGAELEGKVLGIIGCGRIGKRVAKMGYGGFDMNVLVYDPYLTQEQLPAGCTKVDTLEEMLTKADFVTLHAPLTEETRHMINAETLAMMKPTAYLVNCTRGPMIDEAALIAALQNGTIAGAGLDASDPAFALLMGVAKNYPNGAELEGKVLGIIGCGRIGKRVAKMGYGGFDMNVLVYDPYLTQEQLPAGCTKVDTLEEMLTKADFVTLHAPLTEETRHMINAETLAMMKPTAYLVNCARGPMIDEAALIAALQNGTIAGAGLDVTDPEPAAPDNPLFTMDNVILTAHYAPSTVDTALKVSTIGSQNLIAFFGDGEMVGRLV